MIKQLFIIDPPEKLTLNVDTTFLIMAEAVRRGHEVLYCTENDLSWIQNKTGKGTRTARCRKVAFAATGQPDFSEVEPWDLESFDYIHIRKDPPFDQNYSFLCLMLTGLQLARVINDPYGILSHNEKTIIGNFPDLITDTLVGSNHEAIESFIDFIGGPVVIKCLEDASGRGVAKVDSSGDETVIRYTRNFTRPVMFQRFLEQIHKGEMRIFLLDGECISCFKKLPAPDTFKANFDFGATGMLGQPGPKEKRVIERTCPYLKKHGLYLVALDVIDGYLSEINFTSPGLLVQSNRLTGERAEAKILDFIENGRVRYNKAK